MWTVGQQSWKNVDTFCLILKEKCSPVLQCNIDCCQKPSLILQHRLMGLGKNVVKVDDLFFLLNSATSYLIGDHHQGWKFWVPENLASFPTIFCCYFFRFILFFFFTKKQNFSSDSKISLQSVQHFPQISYLYYLLSCKVNGRGVSWSDCLCLW